MGSQDLGLLAVGDLFCADTHLILPVDDCILLRSEHGPTTEDHQGRTVSITTRQKTTAATFQPGPFPGVVLGGTTERFDVLVPRMAPQSCRARGSAASLVTPTSIQSLALDLLN